MDYESLKHLDVELKVMELESDLTLYAFAKFLGVQEPSEGDEFMSTGYVLIPSNKVGFIDPRLKFGYRFRNSFDYTKNRALHINTCNLDCFTFESKVINSTLSTALNDSLGLTIAISANPEYNDCPYPIAVIRKVINSVVALKPQDSLYFKYMHVTTLHSNKTTSIINAFNIVSGYIAEIAHLYNNRKQALINGQK